MLTVLPANPRSEHQGEVKGQRLLVHTGKKGTNCVELVGFESPEAIKHPCPPAKSMTQMLDFNIDEETIIKNFSKAAKLLTLPAQNPVIVEKVAPKPAPVEAKVEATAAPKPAPKTAPVKAAAKKPAKK